MRPANKKKKFELCKFLYIHKFNCTHEKAINLYIKSNFHLDYINII